MKYFTKPLWREAQEFGEENRRQWNLALEEYRAQLATLQPRLTADAYKFYNEGDLHDGELLELRVIDGSRPASLSEAPRPWQTRRDYPITVSLNVLDARDQFVWHVSYRSLRRVVIDFPTDEPTFFQEGEGFGDLGYHELTDAGNGFLRHEVLFASGAVLLFEFKDIAVTCNLWRLAI